ncbi:MAG: MmgE/PrpD family protein, partial [Alphaproteobacteria bacterium]|nr:MmgE/PrpD family protein [Alphaproteobacteria bacterium]
MSSADAVAPLPESDITAAIAERAAALRFADLTPDAVSVAGQCLLDWFAVTIAGASEPLVRMLVAEAIEEGGIERASLIGAGRGTLAQAALINGAAGHALDYDDVHQAMKGHPTVPLVPAILALGESLGANGRDLVTAFVAGYESECRIGLLVAPGHYGRGFHATATIGCFGAAAASANLMGLDAEATARALGIVGTQAAGLKS